VVVVLLGTKAQTRIVCKKKRNKKHASHSVLLLFSAIWIRMRFWSQLTGNDALSPNGSNELPQPCFLLTWSPSPNTQILTKLCISIGTSHLLSFRDLCALINERILCRLRDLESELNNLIQDGALILHWCYRCIREDKCLCRLESRRHGGALVGFASPNKAPRPPIWTMHHYKSAGFLANFRMSRPPLLKTFWWRLWSALNACLSCTWVLRNFKQQKNDELCSWQ